MYLFVIRLTECWYSRMHGSGCQIECILLGRCIFSISLNLKCNNMSTQDMHAPYMPDIGSNSHAESSRAKAETKARGQAYLAKKRT